MCSFSEPAPQIRHYEKASTLLPLLLLFCLPSFESKHMDTQRKSCSTKTSPVPIFHRMEKILPTWSACPLWQGEKSEYNSQIWVAAADGSFDVQYTRGEKSSTAPQFSPDGKQIAFLSNRAGDKNQVFVVRVMGGEAEQITDAKTGVASFKWSPDGTRICLPDERSGYQRRRENEEGEN